jgi:hypothetical protein
MYGLEHTNILLKNLHLYIAHLSIEFLNVRWGWGIRPGVLKLSLQKIKDPHPSYVV